MGEVSQTWKAYTCKKKGQDFELADYQPTPLGNDDIQIKVTHNGLCHSDLHLRDDDWGNSTFPLVAGHEVVGIVEEVGSHVTSVKKGERVAYGWLRDSCRACSNCIVGQENICKKGYSGFILGGNKGGFQPRLRAPADFAIKVPGALPSGDAAVLMCAGVTVYQPLRTHWTRPGMKVGVIGIGGLGHVALQMAKAMGGEVTAFSTSANKEAEAKSFGADKFVVYNPNAKVGAGYGIQEDQKVELLINCSPALPPEGNYNNQLSMLETNGTLVLTGIPPTASATISILDVVFNQKKIAGSIVGGRAVLNEMLLFSAVNKIKPQLQIMKLSQLNAATKIVAANKARYRIVLETDE